MASSAGRLVTAGLWGASGIAMAGRWGNTRRSLDARSNAIPARESCELYENKFSFLMLRRY